MFNRYRNAAQTLRRLKSMSQDAAVREKFDAILAAIGD